MVSLQFQDSSNLKYQFLLEKIISVRVRMYKGRGDSESKVKISKDE